jgi:hypothetical protein
VIKEIILTAVYCLRAVGDTVQAVIRIVDQVTRPLPIGGHTDTDIGAYEYVRYCGISGDIVPPDADINLDCNVDFIALSLLAADYLSSDLNAELTGDNWVDMQDIGRIMEHCLNTAMPMSTSAMMGY